MKEYINNKKVIQFFTELGYIYEEKDFREIDCGIMAYFYKGKNADTKTISYKEAELIYNKALTIKE